MLRKEMTRAALAAALGGFMALAAAAATQEDERLDEVTVTGRRLSDAATAIGTDQATATVAITRDALLSAPAGITALKVLESLPGFNVQANDALGMYEFGNSVRCALSPSARSASCSMAFRWAAATSSVAARSTATWTTRTCCA